MDEARKQAAHRKAPLLMDAEMGGESWVFRVHPDGNVDVVGPGEPDPPAEPVVDQEPTEDECELDSDEPAVDSVREDVEFAPLSEVDPALVTEAPGRSVQVMPPADGAVAFQQFPRRTLPRTRVHKSSAPRSGAVVLVASLLAVAVVGALAWRALAPSEASKPQPQPTQSVEVVDGVAGPVEVMFSHAGAGGVYAVVVPGDPAPIDPALWSLEVAGTPVDLSVDGSRMTGSAAGLPPGEAPWALSGPDGLSLNGVWSVQ